MRIEKLIIITAVAILAALVALHSTVAYALTASTNKSVYHPGDVLVVSGYASKPNDMISFAVYNPEGSLVTPEQTVAGSNGFFNITILKFPSQKLSNFPEGYYTIVVEDTNTGDKLNLTVYFTYSTTTTTTTSQAQTATTQTVSTVTVTSTVTVVKTVTIVKNYTLTTTLEKTTTKTVPTTTTTTATTTTTVTTTSPTTTTTTKTVTVTKVSVPVTAASSVVALIVGIGAALAISRR